MAELKFKTKYFGNILIDVDDDGHGGADLVYDGQSIDIFLSEFDSYGDKKEVCLEILDKYVEINEVARRAILENFSSDETVNYYFKCHFDILDEEDLRDVFGVDEFDEIDIKNVVERLEYPDLLFGIEGSAIEFSVDYMVAKEYSDEILCVKMDENLNVTGFSHES